MAKWSKIKVNPEQINNGNEYTINDNVSIESLNGIVNNSFKAQEDAERALELATGANEANGTVVKINGEPQGTWDATHSQRLYEESSNILNPENCVTNYNVEQDIFEGQFYRTDSGKILKNLNLNKKVTISLILYSKPTSPTSFGFYLSDGTESSSNRFSSIQNFEINKVYTRTLDSLSTMVMWTSGNPTNSFSFRLWINDGETGKPYGLYNPNRHITNSEAEFLKEEFGKSYNLINIEKSTINKYLGSTGTLIDSSASNVSDFLKINPNEKYAFNCVTDLAGSRTICFYDSNKNHISNVSYNELPVTIISPENSKYIRITYWNQASNVIFNKGEPLPYQPYNSASHITNQQADLLKSEYDKQVNLIDFTNVVKTSNATISISGNTITIIDSEEARGFFATPCKLEKGKTYTFSYKTNGVHNDVVIYNNTLTSAIQYISTGSARAFTYNSDISDVRIVFYGGKSSTNTASYSDIMLVEGSYTSETMPSYQQYNGSIIHEKDIKPVLLWKFGQIDVVQNKQEDLTMLSRAGYEYIIIAYQAFKGWDYVRRYAKFKMISSSNNVIVINDSISPSGRSSRRVIIKDNTTFTINEAYIDGQQNNAAIIIQEIYGSNY